MQKTGHESPQSKTGVCFFVFVRASGVPQWYFAVFEMQTTIFHEKTQKFRSRIKGAHERLPHLAQLLNPGETRGNPGKPGEIFWRIQALA